MSRFVKAEPGMKHSVIYTDDTGKHFRFSGGTWAWRNHNPGNIRPGKISKRHNQIGVVFNFAVFPDKILYVRESKVNPANAGFFVCAFECDLNFCFVLYLWITSGN